MRQPRSSAEAISLLWPLGHQAPAGPAAARPFGDAPSADPGSWWADLGLEALAQALDYGGRRAGLARTILPALCAEPDVILYRQEILADVMAGATLRQGLDDLLPALRELEEIGRHRLQAEDNELLRVVRRLRELELYVAAVRRCLAALEAGAALSSRGLLLLRERLACIAGEDGFRRLEVELPALRAAMHKLSSVSLGVNLDEQGRPVAATLLSVNDTPFIGKRGFLARMLGEKAEETAGEGIAPLHVVAEDSPSPFLQPIFRDLAEVLRLVCQPVAQALAGYLYVNAAPLSGRAAEIAFYLGACRLAERLRAADLPLCQPVLLAAVERASRVRGLYNLVLALRLLQGPPPAGQPARPLPSNLEMGAGGRSFVLTGPNMGGKTTYLQATGLAHVLAQAGLFVPGESAEIAPVDAVYTHFPQAESYTQASGRLGEEAQRLAAIFGQATPHSLILLNESLSSTSPGESLYLAQDIVCGLRLLGARAIFATHLHELAVRLAESNAIAPDEPPTGSLVAGVVPPEQRAGEGDLGRTYRIAPGSPEGLSYAEEIAQRHGISLSQLRAQLHRRGIGS